METNLQKGRNTIAQKVVLEHIRRIRKPETLEEIHVHAQKKIPHLAFSTVYRILKSLEEKGTVERMDWRDRGSRYEIVNGHHHHLVCESCGAMTDIEDSDLSLNLEKISTKTGFTLTSHAVELSGLCQKCAKA